MTEKKHQNRPYQQNEVSDALERLDCCSREIKIQGINLKGQLATNIHNQLIAMLTTEIDNPTPLPMTVSTVEQLFDEIYSNFVNEIRINNVIIDSDLAEKVRGVLLVILSNYIGPVCAQGKHQS